MKNYIPFKIHSVDPGMGRIIYTARNPKNEIVYYAICQEAPETFKLYRLDQKFEAQNIAYPCRPLWRLFEAPSSFNSKLESDIRSCIIYNKIQPRGAEL